MFNTQNLWATLHRWTWAISHSRMLIDHSWQVGWHCQHGSLAQDSSRFADHALHGLWGRHHLLLSRLGNIGDCNFGQAARARELFSSHIGVNFYSCEKKMTSKLDFPYLDCSMSRWGRLHCLQSSRSRWVGGGVEFPIATRTLFLGCFELLAVFGWPSTSTWSKRLFFQNSQSQSFSAVILINAGEYCDIAKSDAIGCPLIKAMVWISCFGWPMLTNMQKKSVFLSPPSPTLACYLEFGKCCAF